jgi:MerR family copper efflux transcriptional regulator
MEEEIRDIKAGDVAARVGVSKDTLRHYERLGLLPAPPRSSGGYRLYAESDVVRVFLIRRALAVGLSLDEISEFLGIRDMGGAPCRNVFRAVERKRSDLDRKIVEMTRFRDEIDAILVDWQGRLDSSPNEPARLLDSLPPAASRTTT